MPDGSPIDQWWKSHTPTKVTTDKKTATHFWDGQSYKRALCGHRNGTATNGAALVTCSACLAALAADQTNRSEA